MLHQFKWSQDNGYFWRWTWGMEWRREHQEASNVSVMFYFLTKTNKILILIKLGFNYVSTRYSLYLSLYLKYFILKVYLKVGKESDSTLCLQGKLWNNNEYLIFTKIACILHKFNLYEFTYSFWKYLVLMIYKSNSIDVWRKRRMIRNTNKMFIC